jgi:transketolase
MVGKWESFGWQVRVVDGHDIPALIGAMSEQWKGKPLLLMANTVKGKGVSFMERNKDWHHNVLTKDLYELAMKEQGGLHAD